MNGFFQIIITSGVMILFTAAFRGLFAKRLHKRAIPVLWAIITLRLMIPIPISIPILPASFDISSPSNTDNGHGKSAGSHAISASVG